MTSTSHELMGVEELVGLINDAFQEMDVSFEKYNMYGGFINLITGELRQNAEEVTPEHCQPRDAIKHLADAYSFAIRLKTLCDAYYQAGGTKVVDHLQRVSDIVIKEAELVITRSLNYLPKTLTPYKKRE